MYTYLGFMTRSSLINVFAISLTSSKKLSSVSKSHSPAQTLLIVSLSLSPINGERPLNLKNMLSINFVKIMQSSLFLFTFFESVHSLNLQTNMNFSYKHAIYKLKIPTFHREMNDINQLCLIYVIINLYLTSGLI